jgi:hypothetical protein
MAPITPSGQWPACEWAIRSAILEACESPSAKGIILLSAPRAQCGPPGPEVVKFAIYIDPARLTFEQAGFLPFKHRVFESFDAVKRGRAFNVVPYSSYEYVDKSPVMDVFGLFRPRDPIHASNVFGKPYTGSILASSEATVAGLRFDRSNDPLEEALSGASMGEAVALNHFMDEEASDEVLLASLLDFDRGEVLRATRVVYARNDEARALLADEEYKRIIDLYQRMDKRGRARADPLAEEEPAKMMKKTVEAAA